MVFEVPACAQPAAIQQRPIPAPARNLHTQPLKLCALTRAHATVKTLRALTRVAPRRAARALSGPTRRLIGSSARRRRTRERGNQGTRGKKTGEKGDKKKGENENNKRERKEGKSEGGSRLCARPA
eukprot:349625-Rhodomonas_salina.1